ncbi:MAG: hypothetical protein IPJ65_32650 [Archangiaceae bacterium]|nr:hypothetical protein [Archangiaceae bacterium]
MRPGRAFYAVAVLGIIDALWHHKSEVVTFQSQRASDVLTPSKDEGLKPTFNLYPLPGGAGVGFGFQF